MERPPSGDRSEVDAAAPKTKRSKRQQELSEDAELPSARGTKRKEEPCEEGSCT